MLQIGIKQILTVVKRVDFGVYLSENRQKDAQRVLLPKKAVPEGLKEGDEIEVFLYKDSEDRLIATTKTPASGELDRIFSPSTRSISSRSTVVWRE